MCYTKNLQVKEGLCKAAVKHESENRYCNLFPCDSSRVVLTGLATGDYINASWVSLGGVPEHRSGANILPEERGVREEKMHFD